MGTLHTSSRWRRILTGCTVFLLTLTLTATALANTEELTKLAQELTKLRVEVEGLADSISASKNDTQAQLRSLSAQKTELEAQIQREELRLAQVQQEKAKLLEEVARGNAAKNELKPTVLESIAKVRQGVERSLPFKRAGRLDELDKIEKQLKDGLLRPEKAAARLWQFAEDELRLTRESGVYQQTIQVDGDEILADVARLGMVAMYFRTADNRVGRIAVVDGQWRTEKFSDEERQTQVVALFENFKKGIRQGFFTIPNPAPAK
ncbi:MAG: DUF3450 family protein [Myxococcota bacterium]